MSSVTELTTYTFTFLAALFIHNIQVMKPTKLPNKIERNKENGVWIHSGIFPTIKKNKVEDGEMTHGLRALLALEEVLFLAHYQKAYNR